MTFACLSFLTALTVVGAFTTATALYREVSRRGQSKNAVVHVTISGPHGQKSYSVDESVAMDVERELVGKEAA